MWPARRSLDSFGVQQHAPQFALIDSRWIAARVPGTLDCWLTRAVYGLGTLLVSITHPVLAIDCHKTSTGIEQTWAPRVARCSRSWKGVHDRGEGRGWLEIDLKAS